MSRYKIRLATTDDNAALTALCNVPIKGDISLAFERNPDYFTAAQVQCNQPEMYLCTDEDTGQVLGMFGTGYRDLWYNGQRTAHRYFSDLRIAAAASGSRLLLEMGKFVMAQGQLEKKPAQTIIFADNRPMLDLVNQSTERSRRLGLPYYHPVANYTSYLIPYTKKRTLPAKPWHIRPATAADLGAMQAFHDQYAPQRPFYPVLQFDQLDRTPFYKNLKINDFWLIFDHNRLIGMTGVWDQKGFKQTRIVSYARPIALARPVLNLLSPVLGHIPLPAAGQLMPYQSLTGTLVLDDDPTLLAALVGAIRAYYYGSGRAYLLAGGLDSDPLLAAFAPIRQQRSVHGRFFWVSNEATLPEAYRHPLQYFDVARI